MSFTKGCLKWAFEELQFLALWYWLRFSALEAAARAHRKKSRGKFFCSSDQK